MERLEAESTVVLVVDVQENLAAAMPGRSLAGDAQPLLKPGELGVRARHFCLA